MKAVSFVIAVGLSLKSRPLKRGVNKSLSSGVAVALEAPRGLANSGGTDCAGHLLPCDESTDNAMTDKTKAFCNGATSTNVDVK